MYKLGKFELPDPTDPRWEANKPLPAANPVFTCGPVTVYREGRMTFIKVGGIDIANCDPKLLLAPYEYYAGLVIDYVEKREEERNFNRVTELLSEFNQRFNQRPI